MTKHSSIEQGEEVGGAYIQASMLGGVHHVPKILVMDQSNALFERNINN